MHRFKVGDQARLAFGFHDRDAAGLYPIVKLMPADEHGSPQYRIVDLNGQERVISERQIDGIGATTS